MPRIGHSATQIIDKLRTVERHLAEGKSVAEAIAAIEVSEPTYYRWRKQFGGMDRDDAKRLKELERENARLKKLVADLALQNDILKEVNEGNF